VALDVPKGIAPKQFWNGETLSFCGFFDQRFFGRVNPYVHSDVALTVLRAATTRHWPPFLAVPAAAQALAHNRASLEHLMGRALAFENSCASRQKLSKAVYDPAYETVHSCASCARSWLF
jgi:hypothetical protein